MRDLRQASLRGELNALYVRVAVRAIFRSFLHTFLALLHLNFLLSPIRPAKADPRSPVPY
jgi:hypothetical protein